MSDPKPYQDEAFRVVGDLTRLRLSPGDVVVLKIDEVVSEHTVRLMHSWLSPYFPGHPLVVLQRGMELGAIGADGAP